MKELVIPDELNKVQSCVYKISYNDHYIVVMANQLEWSIKSISSDLNRFRKGVREGFSGDNLYSKFCYYVIKNPDCEFSIEIYLRTESQYELLRQMQIELATGIDDVRCLNSKFTPYINKKLQSNKQVDDKGKQIRKGHINRGTVLNFLRWKKKNYPALVELRE